MMSCVNLLINNSGGLILLVQVLVDAPKVLEVLHRLHLLKAIKNIKVISPAHDRVVFKVYLKQLVLQVMKYSLLAAKIVINKRWCSLSMIGKCIFIYIFSLTLSSKVAFSSATMIVLGCCWKADTVHMWFTPSSIAWTQIDPSNYVLFFIISGLISSLSGISSKKYDFTSWISTHDSPLTL